MNTSLQPSPVPLPAKRDYRLALKNTFKTFLGKQLVALCDTVPAAKPLLRPAGMRTFEGFFGCRSPVRAQTPSGDAIYLTTAVKNYLTLQLFWKGTVYYEPISTRLILELLKKGETFVDVGANIGFFSLVVARNRPNVNVFAFEPNPKNYDVLRNNIAANHFTNVRAERLALSDASGTGALYLHASDMSASLTPGFQDELSSGRGSAPVELTTIDAYFESPSSPVPAVIKVDVEGYEAAVLRGAHATLRKHGPDLVLEVLESYPADIVDMLSNLGYLFYQITDQGLTPAKELKLVKRGDLTFLNHLLSRKPFVELAPISDELVRFASSFDLRKTSKYFGPRE